MEVTVKGGKIEAVKTPALIVFLFKEDRAALAGRPELAAAAPLIGPRIKAGDFTADASKTMILYPDGPLKAERLVVVGLGGKAEFQADVLRRAAAAGVQTARRIGAKSATICAPPDLDENLGVATATLGGLLGLYQFDELKTKDDLKARPFQGLTVRPAGGKTTAGAKKAAAEARVTGDAVFAARDLVNRPANMIYPESLADEARKMASEAGVDCTVMTREEAEKRGMGAFAAVAQGSDRPGRIVILEYRGAAKNQKPVALVGKGVTFDSGGLCIKPADGMKNMKTDMSGAAAVIAAVCAAARLELKVNVVAVAPLLENMPSGTAYHPGDVLKTLSGQTVEVINTDAEGRLILADALTLAAERKPRVIVDLATLTGACVVALGGACAGLFATNEKLRDQLMYAARHAGERLWPLPLIDEYFEDMKSETADFKHTAGREGGAIIAALFLKQFVGDVPWAHLDIAGPARNEKDLPDAPKGGTGFGVRVLIEYLKNV
jgi:leucyl aminopeptidase